MNAEIVSIGTELLMGETVDTNSTHIAAELAKLGIELRWGTKVGDDPDRLFEVLDRAFRRSDITVTSGGLGPTSDDLTRETIARVFGEQMEVQDDLLKHLKSQFAGRGFPMPETNVKQATLIPSAQVIPNPLGTAPGWWAEDDGHVIIAMPGPPRELQRMWTYEVAPRLKQRNPGIAIVTRTLKTFGISEGGLDEMLSPLFKSRNPLLGIYSKQDGIHLRAIATAPDEDEARTMIEPMESEIRRIIGDEAIWGTDDETPESQLAELLISGHKTLGIIEEFTGGLLASTLSELPSSHEFLRGGVVTTSPDVVAAMGVDTRLTDEHGPASAPVAEAMAEAARRHFNADVGLAVTGLVTEPTRNSGPMGTSYMGFAVGNGSSSTSGHYPTRRLRIRSRATTHALLGLIQAMRA